MKKKTAGSEKPHDQAKMIMQNTLDRMAGGHSGQRELLASIQAYLDASYKIFINPLEDLRITFPQYKWKWWDAPIPAWTPRELSDAVKAFDYLWIADGMYLVGARRIKRLDGWKQFDCPIVWADSTLNRDHAQVVLLSGAMILSNNVRAHAIAGALMSEVSFPEGKLLPTIQVMCANIGKQVMVNLAYRRTDKSLTVNGTLKGVDYINRTNYGARLQDYATVLVLSLKDVATVKAENAGNEFGSPRMTEEMAIHEVAGRDGWLYQPEVQKFYFYCPEEIIMRDSIGWIIQSRSFAEEGPTSFMIRI